MLYFILPLLFSLISFTAKRKNIDYIILVSNSVLNAIFTVYIVFIANINLKYFAVDAISKPFLLILSIVFFSSSLYSIYFLKKREIDERWHSIYTLCFILFDSLMMLSLMSVHIGLYWVLLEATTILTAPLIYFNKTKHSLEAAWKYVFICSIGIAIGFIGIIFLSITFRHSESLFFADFYGYSDPVSSLFLKIAFLFIIVGFGTKAGLAPLHFWLPDAHSEAPSPVSAMLSATLLNTAMIGIIRVLKAMYIFKEQYFANTMLLLMGFMSLFVSAVFILRIKNYKRILAYSSIENMGIIAVALASGGAGILAGIIHTVSHSLLKASLFLTSGNILDRYETKHYDETGPVMKDMKMTGIVFGLSVFGILAIPPSLSFLSEFKIMSVFISGKNYFLMVLFMLLLTVVFYGFIKMLLTMMFGEKDFSAVKKEYILQILPQMLLLIFAFGLGLFMPSAVKQILLDAANWIGG
ncbi:TPA: hydrogenase [candidate division WOR-3 bacterium]|jgi:hydrogenase-4 component F|uniref:Hydrogenase n=1 Tax=candidate division WOR-3 bacterium TaxID=2052148 RepID=A0A350HB14_UNCW3|nr:hydrogenase [candidate division WOR-3 bacterium]